MAHRFAPHNGKRYQPTDDHRRQVLTMTGFGLRQDEIATALQIDKKTLHKYFRRELDMGMIEANVRVAQALYQNAVQHNSTAAQIWWTKARMKWKETSVVENRGNGTLQVDFRWADAPPAPRVINAIADGTKSVAGETTDSDNTDVTFISDC